MANGARRFKQAEAPGRQPGELARLKILQGPDYGTVFVIGAAKVTVGRGEDNDVVLLDLKSSRRHVEFVASASGWEVKDLGSSNGVLLNGKPSRGGTIRTGDTLKLGETTLEFMGAEQATKLLLSPPKSLAQVSSEQQAEAARRDRVRALGAFGKFNAPSTLGQVPGAAPAPQAAAKKGGARAVLMALLVGGLAAFFMLDDAPLPGKAPRKAPSPVPDRDLASMLPEGEFGETAAAANQFFRAGFREYRERNYLRARLNFETVLQMAPGHLLATHYMDKCTKEVEEMVKGHLETGRRSFVAGKLRDARSNFEAVTRLLARDPSNPAFIEARDQLEKTVKRMKGEG